MLKFRRKEERTKENEAERRERREGRKEMMEKERREMKCERMGWCIGTEETKGA